MNCLKLAEKLAAKSNKNFSNSPISPPTRKVEPANRSNPSLGIENTEVGNESNESEMKPRRIQFLEGDKYVPPFSRIFTDKNLHHYFARYCWERHLIAVLDFLDSIAKYKDKFPQNRDRQLARHQDIMHQLGLLPADYINATVSASEEMRNVSITSFDQCSTMLKEYLQKREFKAFLDSSHYIKWTLKYYNTEKD